MRPVPPLILVVEDDPDVSDGMVALLEEEGYRTEAAADGAEALSKLRASPDAALVLLDLTMPKMSAGEFRAQQRKDPAISHVPILLMSAGLDVRRQAEALGAVAYIPKPFKPKLLLDTLAGVLQSNPAASA